MALTPMERQQAVTQTDPQQFIAALFATLKQQYSASNFAADPTLELISSLAEISPTCQNILSQHSIQSTTQIKQLCAQLLQDDNAKQIQAEFALVLKNSQRAVRAEQTAYTEQLRTAIHRPSAHSRAVRAEANDEVNKTITANRDKAYYDVNVLGVLLASLLDLQAVSVDEKYYPRGFNYTPKSENDYLKHVSAMHGGEPILSGPSPLKLF